MASAGYRAGRHLVAQCRLQDGQASGGPGLFSRRAGVWGPGVGSRVVLGGGMGSARIQSE